MRVGITYRPQDDLFYSGWNQTALTLAELFFKSGAHDVTLLTHHDTLWWEDYPKKFNTAPIHETTGLDLLIDIDGRVTGSMRGRVASTTVVFLRTFLQFAEMDASVYLETPYVPRSFEHVSEIWCWDILNPEATLPSIQTLFPCPIRRVPFVWSPSVVKYFSHPRVHASIEEPQTKEWVVHVAEKNKENMSSSVLPLVAIKELVTQKVWDAEYLIHNMDVVKDSKFLKENVLVNIESDSLPLKMVDKEPFYQWKKGHILLSHSRFTPIRLGLLNAVWMGLPVIHNSPILRDLHPSLKSQYYQGNHIGGIVDACKRMNLEKSKAESKADCDAVREAIQNAYGIEGKRAAWESILQTVKPVHSTVHSTVHPEEFVIAFSDMWPGFNPHQNFIMDALRASSTHTFKGIPYSADVMPHLVIAGPYSENWKEIAAPIVFFSAENWELPVHPSIRLYLTSSAKEDATHFRVPTWMTFIDWYSNETTLPTNTEDNPIRLPLHFATTPHPKPFAERTAFCAFVVSNPCCAFRNQTFEAVHAYRHVDSGGSLYNNIGGTLSLKYPGGGCGDISKHEFFKEHRFTISFENSQSPGYVTEKLLHAKMAGCVPLYWGDATESDFVPNSYVNLSTATSPSKVVEVIQVLEQNPTVCETIANTPLLDEPRVRIAKERMTRMCQKILSLIPKVNPRVNLQVSPSEPSPSEPTPSVSKDTLKGLPQGLDAIYIINLDHRADRMATLLEAEPYLKCATRVSGVNGKTLEMTADIYRMFERNEFQWKKSIIGCNLSHISVWKRIAESDKNTVALVLEDDVRFKNDWLEKWPAYQRTIPADADLLYLGGVLPPNQPALPSASRSVNTHWSQIIPNTLFSPTVPLPVFHFCAYSYVLTQKGAQKLMSYMMDSDKRSFTVSDHLLGHPAVGLVKYHANPLLTFCFQEADPVYVASQFNDLHRQDTFDSDIWNNTECFQHSELEPFKRASEVSASQVSASQELVVHSMTDNFEPYERTWLNDMFPCPIRFRNVENVELGPNSWFVIQRPHSFTDLFREMDRLGIPFHVIHLSDEFSQDDISFYTLERCKTVIRNYLRPDVPNLPHIHTIPLGYHHKYKGDKKPIHERELAWSFHGTDWFDRSKQLTEFIPFVPYRCNLQPNWNHPTATRESVYLAHLSNSRFCPILKGQNAETFRLYEALEAGTLPITTNTDEAWLAWIEKELGLSSLYPWTNPIEVLKSSVSDAVRQEVSNRWEAWKERVRRIIQTCKN